MWAQFFPENCPPSDAIDALGEVFRFIRKGFPTQKDFVSFKEAKMHKDFGPMECQACGLSVFRSITDCIEFGRLNPHFRGKEIAKAHLLQGKGKILRTPSASSDNHHTWWIPYSEKEVWKLFEKVEKSV